MIVMIKGLVRRWRVTVTVAACLMALAHGRTAAAQIANERACDRAPGFDSVQTGWANDTSGFRRWLTRGRYERLVSSWQCRRIVYLSDGLRVVGYIYRPASPVKRHAAIIVNRGGTGDFGMMHPYLQSYYLPYLDAGYILLMSQYRGADGSEGKDEYGGADITDVTSLAEIARTLPYVDPDNLFMLGFSRGGMMTYRAAALSTRLRAAATVSGLTNLARQTEYRPDMRESVFKELFPDFDQREADHYRLRSAVEWADRIQTPLLLIHGTADDRVRADDALQLASSLLRAGRSFELVIFDGDVHGVPAHKLETDRRVIAWFDRHRR
jgi:dipeptidyl aminopeptidase/acylaminoacyl peptidase